MINYIKTHYKKNIELINKYNSLIDELKGFIDLFNNDFSYVITGTENKDLINYLIADMEEMEYYVKKYLNWIDKNGYTKFFVDLG